MHIRQARLEDVDSLSELAMRSKASHGYDHSFMEACREELRIDQEALAHRDLWVAETDADGIVGFFGLWPPEDAIAEVDPMFVEPRFHGRGIGRTLWDHLEQRARDANAIAIRLDADPNAVAFYERMGCVIIGEAPSGSIAGRYLPQMEKALAGPQGEAD
ncbi:MAG: GNAT family N-acetyltransferase [Hoeflea sp.]|uniref:GNAT family N-acetyltransferase n=1 Tax=Hoeflea sp. TaxID=1940281 RepID=UPI001D61546E|nr:GNAT family N-acetyltransferase [Hoeflea sp.]MBU4529480.1 GNAT family N-acetyltransferase [Alphaproteobacteria bacterium]MBU4546599.1 GNAT family N-acetyltransferase [Alphaproteobacteria bacterium]MBU4550867.1 GNAT family N-acetyltransferase [Alphaproteobacteria bacterium]MBV1723809.1 GNAT family N-acetyltransferase [Hoeflea sp.]MBV1763086.1 GNAT family N-acetyltransferase [Hoeflea sp.]